MKSISIICCHTGEDKLAYLSDSLEQQSIPYEAIFLDNSGQRYSSASLALNAGAEVAHGDLLMFAHQDVRFKDKKALEDLCRLCEVMEPGDVGGVAGAISVKGRKVTKTNITHSAEERHYAPIDALPSDYMEVDSIDECLIMMPRETWENHHFDESLCDDWHCYGVEQSLFARKGGHKVYVFDARVNHLSSTGTLSQSFFDAVIRLVRHYEHDFNTVVATTGIWPVRGLWLTVAYVRLRESVKVLVRRLRARD